MDKGLAYEHEVAKEIEIKIADGDFGLHPSQANVIYKPEYFSRDRNKNIVFDVSIEIRRKGASLPYLIWVWECNNYNHKVPVDDVEEFHAKLEQIGADKTKGTMITPVGFDRGTIDYAQSKGIGLWRYIPQGSLVCLNEDNYGVRSIDIVRALTISETTGFRFLGSFYGMTSTGVFTIDQDSLIQAELKDIIEI